MSQRQLNIRSDEAAARAAELSRRLNKSTTEIVVEALRAYAAQVEPRDELGLTAEQREDYDALRALSREAAKHRVPGATSDHSWLYDEHGLPK